MGILQSDTDAEIRLDTVYLLITKAARKTLRYVNGINKAINNGVLVDIATEAGANTALMLSAYNKMLDLVEEALGERPTAYIGHAENPA